MEWNEGTMFESKWNAITRERHSPLFDDYNNDYAAIIRKKL